jgi:hypothetical protein
MGEVSTALAERRPTTAAGGPATRAHVRPGERGPLGSSGYPRMLCDLLDALADRIMSVDHVTSVLLVGSTSRGEATVRVVDGRLELFGDIELILVTDPRPPSRDAVSSAVSAVAAEWDGRLVGPIQVDFTLVPAGRLPRSEKKLFVFEARERGLCLRGEHLLDRLPAVSIENMSFFELNEVILHRLEALLKAIERPVNDSSEDSVRLHQWYAVARNYLDVATLLLPYTGVLLPSYCERAKYVSEHADLEFLPHLPANFRERLATYTEWKLKPDDIPLDEPPNLHGCLLALEGGERWIRSRLQGRVFRRFHRRRRTLVALHAAGNAVLRREASLTSALRWLISDTLESRYRFLLDLLHSADGVCCASRRLRHAALRAGRFGLRSSEALPGDEPLWAGLRRRYLASWDVHQPRAVR